LNGGLAVTWVFVKVCTRRQRVFVKVSPWVFVKVSRDVKGFLSKCHPGFLSKCHTTAVWCAWQLVGVMPRARAKRVWRVVRQPQHHAPAQHTGHMPGTTHTHAAPATHMHARARAHAHTCGEVLALLPNPRLRPLLVCN
jgi:hypothetical protein